MAFEKSLLEIIEKRDAEAAAKLILPYNPEQHSGLLQFDPRGGDYWLFTQREVDAFRSISGLCRFSFDGSSGFFIHNGGHTQLRPGDDWVDSTSFERHRKFLREREMAQSYQLDGTSMEQVLHGQPDEGLVSILVGRMPPLLIDADPSPGLYHSRETGERPKKRRVDAAVYVYVESGRRVPDSRSYIDGNAPLSSERPILYLAYPFPKNAPIVTKGGITERIIILVPQSLSLLKQRPS